MIALAAKDLDIGANAFMIKTHFEDRNGKKYTKEESFEISLVDVTFSQRIKISVNKFGNWVLRLFGKG